MIPLFFLFGVIITILLLGCSFFVGYMVWGLLQKQKMAPYIGSFSHDLLFMKQHLNLRSGKSLVDLGCGDGKALRFFVDTFGLHCWGYDLNPFAVYLGKILNYFGKYKIFPVLERKNFLSITLSKFDYIYVYLLPEQMAYIENWIWKNKKKEAIVIANSFVFSQHKPFKIFSNGKKRSCVSLYR